MQSNESIVRLEMDPHVLWVGCGDMLRRSLPAIEQLAKCGARLAFTDILERAKVKQAPPKGRFFNVGTIEGRNCLRKLVSSEPFTHIYVANWPQAHLLSAFKYSDSCPNGTIVIAKPLDTNFALIETVAQNVFPSITEKIYLHDHYLNKSVVGQMYAAFPKLTRVYGELKEFQFYVIEYNTIEEEGRLEALAKGVIFDLESHLLALAQLFFNVPPRVLGYDFGLGGSTRNVQIRINQVARARYIRCQLGDAVETFAAIDLTVLVERRVGEPQEIRGLLVVGKGLKPTESVEADLKGMRFKFALAPRTANFSSGVISPPLTDIEVIKDAESGFFGPIVSGLSSPRPSTLGRATRGEKCHKLMDFEEAIENSRLLQSAIDIGKDNLTGYRPQKTTVREVIARCVSEGKLDPRWLPVGEFADIGYTN
jgi:hypothetical protein